MDTSAPFTACQYGPDAEFTHEFAGIEKFNESVYVNFVDPVSEVSALMRIGNRPTLGYSEATVQLTLPGGKIALRAGRQPNETNDKWSTQGLEIAPKDATRTWEVNYRNTVALISTPSLLADRGRQALKNSPSLECEISLTFEASVPMFTIEEGGDCTPGSSQIATDHYEQFGHVSGSVRVGSTTWTVDRATSFRDHSWGPREWASYNGEWLAAWLADGTAITAYGEFEPNGVRVSGGVVITPDGVFHPIRDYTVYTDYAGEATYDGRNTAVIAADGLPTMVLDGTINHFVPVTQRTADRAARMGQMSVRYANGHGGWGIGEFLRPISAR
ncbi:MULTISPECIES: hypothetical protein [Mycolicibacterium]|uniref:DUF2804 domain-containing protein n=2 Tax=unclassified Mycobacterium TaxID=2642494 RepID=A0A5Q5BHD5_MYCSS|nr:hypothetical protein [Mycolicibacterium monacense]OBB75183.1 hypothetical protein A6B34_13635 [Mycolicibacterium monacense]